jgi:hypothetical protein
MHIEIRVFYINFKGCFLKSFMCIIRQDYMRKQKTVVLHTIQVEFGVFGKVKWGFLLVGCTLD